MTATNHGSPVPAPAAPPPAAPETPLMASLRKCDEEASQLPAWATSIGKAHDAQYGTAPIAAAPPVEYTTSGVLRVDADALVRSEKGQQEIAKAASVVEALGLRPVAAAPSGARETEAGIARCECGHAHVAGMVNGALTILPACREYVWRERPGASHAMICPCTEYRPEQPVTATGDSAPTPPATEFPTERRGLRLNGRIGAGAPALPSTDYPSLGWLANAVYDGDGMHYFTANHARALRSLLAQLASLRAALATERATLDSVTAERDQWRARAKYLLSEGPDGVPAYIATPEGCAYHIIGVPGVHPSTWAAIDAAIRTELADTPEAG